MTDQGMNADQIERVFGALSRIETNQKNFSEDFKAHLNDDKIMAVAVQNLQLAHARQKGFMTALAGAGSIVAGIVGYVIEFFVSGRGHH